MAWLSQNWLWIAGAVAVFLLMSRMGGCGMGRPRRDNSSADNVNRTSSAADDRGTRTAFDPVSGQGLALNGAPISSVYHNRAYFFETTENRNEFEAHPEKYTGSPSDRGIPLDAVSDQRPRHHHHGC